MKYLKDLQTEMKRDASQQLEIQVWSVETSGLEIEREELSVFQATGFSEVSNGAHLEKKILRNEEVRQKRRDVAKEVGDRNPERVVM